MLELPSSEDIIEDDVLDVEKLTTVGAKGIEVVIDGAEPRDIEEDELIADSLEDMELEELGLDCMLADEDATGATLMSMGDVGTEVELIPLFSLIPDDPVLEDIALEDVVLGDVILEGAMLEGMVEVELKLETGSTDVNTAD